MCKEQCLHICNRMWTHWRCVYDLKKKSHLPLALSDLFLIDHLIEENSERKENRWPVTRPDSDSDMTRSRSWLGNWIHSTTKISLSKENLFIGRPGVSVGYTLHKIFSRILANMFLMKNSRPNTTLKSISFTLAKFSLQSPKLLNTKLWLLKTSRNTRRRIWCIPACRRKNYPFV